MVRIVSSNDSWDWEELRKTCLQVTRRYARNSAEAEDSAQNALLRAWRNKAKLRDGERRKEWVSRIARNEALRERERRVPDPIEDFDSGGEEDPRLPAIIDREAVGGALRSLSAQERELIRLRYETDLTQSAIADHLGIPEGTVKVRLYRVRDKLRGMEIQ